MTLALDRGIRILEELGNAQGLTLSEIASRTGIPKSTAHRLLKRLCEKRLVRQNMMDQRYRSALLLPQQSEVHVPPQDQRLMDEICQQAEALTARVLWPTDIFLPINNELVLVESTRALTPLYMIHCRIQTRVTPLESAAGRVFLAFSDADTERRMLQHYWHSRQVPPSQQARQYQEWQQSLRHKVRHSGFATRAPDYFGERDGGDHLRAIAAPILVNGQVRACINLVWPQRFASEARFIDSYADSLLATARSISARLSDPA